MPTSVRSHAKVNLGLGIGAPRPDGFHGLATVYQTLQIHDVVTVGARLAPVTAISITSNNPRVPRDSRNTAWKMISLALDELHRTAEVEIHIDKRLPVQGGLGAGSANAVAALIGLEAELRLAGSHFAGAQLLAFQNAAVEDLGAPSSRRGVPKGWEIKPPGASWLSRRLALAAQVGSDVPLFLVGGTVLGLDRGQQVSPLPDIEPTWCVVAIPEAGVSTPQAFRDWDALCAAEGLTPEASADKLNKLSRAYVSAFGELFPGGGQKGGSSGVLSKENESCREDLAGPQESALVRTGITSWIENDFERVVFAQHPPLAQIKRLLAAEGTPEAALYASLSGSGSALFALYRTRRDGEAAQERLRNHGTQRDSLSPALRSTLTRTLPRPAYWREMLLESIA